MLLLSKIAFTIEKTILPIHSIEFFDFLLCFHENFSIIKSASLTTYEKKYMLFRTAQAACKKTEDL